MSTLRELLERAGAYKEENEWEEWERKRRAMPILPVKSTIETALRAPAGPPGIPKRPAIEDPTKGTYFWTRAAERGKEAIQGFKNRLLGQRSGEYLSATAPQRALVPEVPETPPPETMGEKIAAGAGTIAPDIAMAAASGGFNIARAGAGRLGRVAADVAEGTIYGGLTEADPMNMAVSMAAFPIMGGLGRTIGKGLSTGGGRLTELLGRAKYAQRGQELLQQLQKVEPPKVDTYREAIGDTVGQLVQKAQAEEQVAARSIQELAAQSRKVRLGGYAERRAAPRTGIEEAWSEAARREYKTTHGLPDEPVGGGPMAALYRSMRRPTVDKISTAGQKALTRKEEVLGAVRGAYEEAVAQTRKGGSWIDVEDIARERKESVNVVRRALQSLEKENKVISGIGDDGKKAYRFNKEFVEPKKIEAPEVELPYKRMEPEELAKAAEQVEYKEIISKTDIEELLYQTDEDLAEAAKQIVRERAKHVHPVKAAEMLRKLESDSPFADHMIQGPEGKAGVLSQFWWDSLAKRYLQARGLDNKAVYTQLKEAGRLGRIRLGKTRLEEEYIASLMEKTPEELVAMGKGVDPSKIFGGQTVEQLEAITKRAFNEFGLSEDYVRNVMRENGVEGILALGKMLERHPAGERKELVKSLHKLFQVDPRANMNKILEVYINGLLSNPATQIVNIISNATMVATIPAKRLFAALVEVPRALISGKPRERFFGEVAADIAGMGPGIIQATRNALNAILHEADDTLGKLEFHGQAIGGTKGQVIRLPSRFLRAGDEFFKTFVRSMESHSRAYRGAVNEALAKGQQTFGKEIKAGNLDWLPGEIATRMKKILENPTEEMLQEVEQAARFATFTQQMGTVGQLFERVRNSKLPFKFLVPFMRTPANIAKTTVRFSPFGALRAFTKEGAEVSDAVAEALLGTTIGAAAIALAEAGLITGGGPASDAERATLRATGWQPNSIKIGDNYVSFSRLDPIGNLFSLAVDVAQAVENPEERWEIMGRTMVENLQNETFLVNFADILNAIVKPEVYAESYVKKQIGGMVQPITALASIARGMDPTVRNVKEWGEATKAKIPGMTKELQPLVDVFGRDIQRVGGVGESVFNPFRRTEVDKTDAKRIADELAKYKIGLTYPKGELEGIKLTANEETFVKKMKGRFILERLKGLIDSPGYQATPDEYKKNALEHAIRSARSQVNTTVRSLKYQRPDEDITREAMAYGVQ